jgi:hypothetical protein
MTVTPYSYREYAGNGSNKDFQVPFPYLLKAHVKVYAGLDLVAGTYTALLVDGVDYLWTSGTQIQATVAPAVGTKLTVRRLTPTGDLLTQWQDGSTLVAEDLITSDKQNLYAVQEQEDLVLAGVSTATAAAAAASSSASASAASSAAAIAAANAATAAAAAVTTTANAAASAANAAVQIATAAAVPQSPLQVLEPLEILVNAAFSVGRPGAIPFGVGPVLAPGAAFSGISQSDYHPIHHASGSFC